MLKVKYEILHTALANKSFTESELIKIANSLAERNEALGITGALLYNNREFIQLLEGEKDNLKNLMSTVEDDTRHGNIHILWEGEVIDFGYSNYGLSIKMKSMINQKFQFFANPTGIISTGQQLMDELSSSFNLTEFAL